ncbi:MAG TPA: hypothetical protein VK025_06865 [Steroidobacter sp.]|jgi:hypothetical protein|nr:hypothetical protein [Steroidobacteraceae bacterium]HLS81106.1 hypothetical protein [Steroidobacter sp.]
MRSRYGHEQCWSLIPWVVNGRANSEETQAVRMHVLACKECRDELARQRELHERMRDESSVIAAPHTSWRNLLERIEADAERTLRKQEVRRLRRKRWLTAAVWVQGAALLLLLAFSFGARERPADYVTLTTPVERALRPDVRVVFAPDASIEQVNDVLRLAGAAVIAGPSEAGVYTLSLGRSNAEDVREALSTLRRDASVVFAEPAGESHR